MIDRVGKPRIKGTWIGTVLRVVNPVVKALLASPIHWPLSRWFMLLSWTGQKSGQARSTPVSYIQEAQGTWVTSGDSWTEQACGNPTLRVRIGGRWADATGTVVEDGDESCREHVRLFREHGWFRILSGIPKRDGKPDEDAVARAIDAGRKLIRIDFGYGA